MDVQKVRADQIDSVTNAGTQDFNITGRIIIPASWIYFQVKMDNLKVKSLEKLRDTLGGRIILDIIVIAMNDEKWRSPVQNIDLLCLDTKSGVNKYYYITNTEVVLLVNGKVVNTLNFSNKYFHGDEKLYMNCDYPEIGFSGDVSQEMGCNDSMMSMVGKYGLRIKNDPIIHDLNELLS